MLPIALGEIGLSYKEFLQLTPRRWELLYKGWQKKKDEQWQMLAWQTAMLINISGKSVEEPVTPDQLLNPKEEKKEPEKPEDILAVISKSLVI